MQNMCFIVFNVRAFFSSDIPRLSVRFGSMNQVPSREMVSVCECCGGMGWPNSFLCQTQLQLRLSWGSDKWGVYEGAIFMFSVSKMFCEGS